MHRFESTATTQEYRKNTPIQTYDTLQSAIETQRDTQETTQTTEQPILYTQTSGTTGEAKYIPITPAALQAYKKQQQLVSYHFYRQCPQAFEGDVLAIVSPAIEGHFDNGIPYGSASGNIQHAMPRWVRDRYVIPSQVFDCKNYEVKYRLIACLALAKRNITYFACANPSTIVRLIALANEDLTTFIHAIKTGEISELAGMDPTLSRSIAERFSADPQRAYELSKLSRKDRLELPDFWPNLKLITTWTGGSCSSALSAITQTLPDSVCIMDIGYLASELRGSITIDAKTQDGLPLLTDHFYEFIEVHKWENGERETCLLHELHLDRRYYLIVTTDTGLYRYFMNDIVRVTGFYHKTPLIKFVQKGKGVTSITGEKLYESQILWAVNQAMKEYQLSLVFVMALADVQNNHYRVYIEAEHRPTGCFNAFAANLDTLTGHRNMEYKNKRDSHRLQCMEVNWLRPGAYEDYKQHCIRQGQREGQFKVIALQYEHNFTYSFEKWIEV